MSWAIYHFFVVPATQRTKLSILPFPCLYFSLSIHLPSPPLASILHWPEKNKPIVQLIAAQCHYAMRTLFPSLSHTNLHLTISLSPSYWLSDLFLLSFQIRLRDAAAELNVLFGATRSSLGFFQVKTNDEKMKNMAKTKNEENKKRKKTIFILQLSHTRICIVDRAGFLTDCFLFISVDSSRHCRPAAFLCYCRTLGSCHLNRKSIGNRPPFGPTNGYCCRWVAHSTPIYNIYTLYSIHLVICLSSFCLRRHEIWKLVVSSFFSIFLFLFVNCDLFCLSQSFVTTHICNPVRQMAMRSPNNVIYWRFNVRESLTAKEKKWRVLSAFFRSA